MSIRFAIDPSTFVGQSPKYGLTIVLYILMKINHQPMLMQHFNTASLITTVDVKLTMLCMPNKPIDNKCEVHYVHLAQASPYIQEPGLKMCLSQETPVCLEYQTTNQKKNM